LDVVWSSFCPVLSNENIQNGGGREEGGRRKEERGERGRKVGTITITTKNNKKKGKGDNVTGLLAGTR